MGQRALEVAVHLTSGLHSDLGLLDDFAVVLLLSFGRLGCIHGLQSVVPARLETRLLLELLRLDLQRAAVSGKATDVPVEPGRALWRVRGSHVVLAGLLPTDGGFGKEK